ncbi:TerD family protein [Clostridium sp. AM27-31LB]|uniref:TerD family protein n=1 Tax=Clostridium sp. AM27-31LB TaxID=2293026 RepID=UPI000E4FE1DE|nr:TerD family protein [Clostridium sp. AM27-31LB]RHT93950.1 TerD family protein [Clostridium sp. AM27-31LB]
MSISLKKGQKVSLTKESAGLSNVLVGLGWDAVESKKGFLALLFGTQAADIDCDATAILLKDGKFCDKNDVVYFGNLEHKSGTVRHMGDNLTGDGEGDDEQILIDLSKVPAEYDRIVIVVNIYDCIKRKQEFGMIKNAFIRIVDGKTNREMCKYDLSEDYSGMTAMIFGEIYRHNGEWKFNAIGQGTKDTSISELCRHYK